MSELQASSETGPISAARPNVRWCLDAKLRTFPIR
jgi:hypothetical protein